MNKIPTSNYEAIFIGDDFCDRLLVSNHIIEAIYSLVQINKMKLGIKTPVISEEFIAKYCNMIDFIVENNMSVMVTVNDWGLLSYIFDKSYKGIEIIIGRFLVRQKTDRFTSSLKGSIPEAVYQHYCSPTLLNDYFLRFAKEKNIRIFEIENVPNEICFPQNDASYLIMLTYPYVCTALTRYCPYYQHNSFLSISECATECRNNRISLVADIHGEYKYISNALVYENTNINDDSNIYMLLDENERGKNVKNCCSNKQL